MTGFPA